MLQEHQALHFSVVGVYAIEPFVRHVALLDPPCRIRYGQPVQVTHMCPPLTDGQTTAHLLGWFDRTTLDDIRKIQLWINDIRTRMPPSIGLTQKMIAQYALLPPILEVRDAVHGRQSYFRFSCTGFVVKCYEDTIGTRLLDWQGDSFPVVGWDQIQQMYPPQLTTNLWRHKDAMGLAGNGPWSIMMPGYLMRSLNRPTAEIMGGPYVPASFTEASYP